MLGFLSSCRTEERRWQLGPWMGRMGRSACSQVICALSPELQKLSCRAELTPFWPTINRMSRGQS
ncbi:hypothetical protein EK904_013107 [Melospiza melodia maxima]|nr:hypothetical protein EK904_013107 [Melospiza melodia maxima]